MATSLELWEVVAPLATRSLDDEHREVLEVGSNISPEIIESRGYYSLSKLQVSELYRLEIIGPDALRAESWMGIPIWRPDGRKHGEVIRLFGGDSPMKYVWPTGLRLAFDVHPSCLDLVHRTDVDVLFTEGIKKGDALLTAAQDEGIPLLVISINGCNGWSTKLENGSSIASPDFRDISWEDRRVYVNSDSDYRTNNNVSRGWNGCATYVSSKTGEHRTSLVVTPPSGMDKQGADDFLAQGHSLGDLLEQAQTPERALSDDSGVRKPLALKSGMRLIRDSGDTIPHMIAPIIPEQSITLVAGHSGTYKTWHMAGLALDGGFGIPWLAHPGLTMEYGPFTTLYVNKEMSGIILGQRLKTLALNERYTTIPDFEQIIEDKLSFTHDSDLDMAIPEERARIEDAIILSGAKIVVLDSLSMSWHGDENSSTEVGALYSALRGIIERTGCSFVLLHHLLKPPGGKPSKTPVVSQFAIRGSGQLYQQADACLMMDLYASSSSLQDPEERLVVIHHLKARTSREMPPWVVKFETNEGLFTSMTYLCGLAEAKARAYSESGGNSSQMEDWIMEECYGMPAMQAGPANPGFRTKQLYLMLQQSWNVEGTPAPSDATLGRALAELVKKGRVKLIEESRRFGNLYQLADETEPEEPIEEVAPSV
jgi:hypothetical protein